MLQNSLIDAGPLIALFSKRDSYHASTLRFLKSFRGKLYTTWPVITEALHMLSFSTTAQMNLLKWINREGLILIEIEQYDLLRIISLTEKYLEVPMDLADATLIVSSEKMNISSIISLDKDFYIYKNIRNQYLKNIFQAVY